MSEQHYSLGLDLGTKTIVLARRGEDGRPAFRQEINGFYEFDKPDQFTKRLLVSQSIPYIEIGNRIFALGQKAEQLAYAFNSTLRRPMSDGTVSKEQEAIKIMASIVHAIIGDVSKDTVLYYCIPANALNIDTNVALHQRIAQTIIDGKKVGAVIKAFPINEARAIAVGTEDPTAISISWGAGMVNVCYTMFGMSIFEFSIVGSGDWVDMETAKSFGYNPLEPDKKYAETPTTICRRKHNIDLSKPINEADRVDQIIMMNYQILIENVVNGIIGGFNKNIDRARIDQPIPIIMAGGTASPKGFADYFSQILKSKSVPFEISQITVHPRTLYAVAEGCLKAAELHID
jgi:hypothetical protein